MSLVHIENCVKQYGSVKALNNLSLTLEAGPPIALIGPNGAGKTTLFSVLCGYLRLTRGSVSVLGEAPGSQALVGRLSSMPQDARMDPHFTVGRQLTQYARLQGLSKQDAKRDVERVLSIVQLPDVAVMRPEALSHGMRKRVSLAQALLGSPELILLDEPTAGIDPPNVKIIRDLVSELSAHMTFVVSSHNLDELERLCKTVVYLENGQLKQTGSVAASNGADDAILTIRLASNTHDAAFEQLASNIDGVQSVVRLAQGDFRLVCHTPTSRTEASDSIPMPTPVDERLLAALRLAGIPYRQLVRGRSLEDRLYGS